MRPALKSKTAAIVVMVGVCAILTVLVVAVGDRIRISKPKRAAQSLLCSRIDSEDDWSRIHSAYAGVACPYVYDLRDSLYCVGHSSMVGVFSTNGWFVDPFELGDEIRRRPDYCFGKPICLAMQEIGRARAFCSMLAEDLSTTVVAALDSVYYSDTGQVLHAFFVGTETVPPGNWALYHVGSGQFPHAIPKVVCINEPIFAPAALIADLEKPKQDLGLVGFPIPSGWPFRLFDEGHYTSPLDPELDASSSLVAANRVSIGVPYDSLFLATESYAMAAIKGSGIAAANLCYIGLYCQERPNLTESERWLKVAEKSRDVRTVPGFERHLAFLRMGLSRMRQYEANP